MNYDLLLCDLELVDTKSDEYKVGPSRETPTITHHGVSYLTIMGVHTYPSWGFILNHHGGFILNNLLPIHSVLHNFTAMFVNLNLPG